MALENIFQVDVPKALDKVVLNKAKYDAILVDEGQDFTLAWWQNLRQWLADDGEMLIVADPTQDLYETAEAWTEEAMKGAGFSGKWTTLDVCYRMPQKLQKLTNSFAKRALPEKAEKLFADSQQIELEIEPTELRWIQCDAQSNNQFMIEEVIGMPALSKNAGFRNLSWSDVTFLCYDHEHGMLVASGLRNANFNVADIFGPTYEIQKRKKQMLRKGNGRIKGSTIHSFKGWESRAIVIQVLEPREPPDRHGIFAALTRLKASADGSILIVVSSWEEAENYGKTWPKYLDKRAKKNR